MGAGRPLEPELRSKLLRGLRDHPGTHVLLARASCDPVGMAVCFQGFSTFLARPLLNVHDLIVIPTARGRGVGWQLLTAVEDLARELGSAWARLARLLPGKRVHETYPEPQ